jgi:peptide/nickel transport system substrate-binding protein
MYPLFRSAVAVAALLAVGASVADARAVKWARSADALTFDPHAQNEGPTTNLLNQVYETILERDVKGALGPGLAESWKVTSDPTVWEFKIRTGVKFHDGTPLTAEDVAFSLDRALQQTSDFKGYLGSVDKVTLVDPTTVHVKTKGPNPLLPANMSSIFVMSKKWAEANNTVNVQDYKEKKDNFAVRNANGTGPYRLVSREQDVRTVLAKNPDYWDKKVPHGITEITYITIKSDATRIAALLSGEVDLVQDMPVQDIERVAKTGGFRVNRGPENRTIFLGMDVGSPELKTSDVKGKNPFADKRVRQAMSMAVDRVAIQRAVMRGESVPANIIAPPFVNGYDKALDALPKVDVDAAKKLLADAGYPNGFSVTFHCPNDRYINDEAICTAVSAMLARIGVNAKLMAQPKGPHFTLIQKNPPETEFFLLGWGVPTYDSHYIFSFLYQTRKDKDGTWNATRYSSAAMDAKIVSLTQETDLEKRNATIAAIWKELADETIYIGLHHQTLAYAMKDDLDIVVAPNNTILMKGFAPVKK